MAESFNQILKKIKEIKIQGAENIAKKGIEAFLLQPNVKSAEWLIEARPTEPLLKNSLNILINSSNQRKDAKRILSYLEKSEEKIAKFGAQLIKSEMNIYSHCHSSTVISILKKAKKQKKNFVVYTSEVAPLYQGRMTAKELSKAGIKVIVVPDMAAETAMKKCDLFLFGADAYTKKGVVNKIGTSILCDIAKHHNIPRYSCGVSLKYIKKIKIENRKGKEVWDERNKLIDVQYPVFDLTKPKFLTGIISEFGIFHYKSFIKRAKKTINNF
jgi:translation initiation factor 2B subunit (eIF-2B alpha/beta/delta family)